MSSATATPKAARLTATAPAATTVKAIHLHPQVIAATDQRDAARRRIAENKAMHAARKDEHHDDLQTAEAWAVKQLALERVISTEEARLPGLEQAIRDAEVGAAREIATAGIEATRPHYAKVYELAIDLRDAMIAAELEAFTWGVPDVSVGAGIGIMAEDPLNGVWGGATIQRLNAVIFTLQHRLGK